MSELVLFLESGICVDCGIDIIKKVNGYFVLICLLS